MRFHLVTILVLVALGQAACVAEAICSKRQECNDSLEDDSEGVCVAQYHRTIDTLRANKEEECHRLAEAIQELDACAAQLDCDDFEENDLGQKCEDEREAFADALDDATNGGEFECSAAE